MDFADMIHELKWRRLCLRPAGCLSAGTALWDVGLGVLHVILTCILLTADLGWLLVVLTQPSLRRQPPLLLVSNVWVHRGSQVLSVLSQVQTGRPHASSLAECDFESTRAHFSTWNPKTVP